MQILRRRRAPEGPQAGPTPYDRWMRWGRIAALALAAALALLSLVPPALDATAQNSGADVNVTAEFYTVLDGGGGYLTWDFAPGAASRLRGAIDTDTDGRVSEAEFNTYQQSVDRDLDRSVLVLRNFEIAAVRVVEQQGFVGVGVADEAPAHLKVIMNGKWAGRDLDIPLVGGGAVEVAYLAPQNTDRVRERTVVVAAGVSSFGPLSGEARAPRVPAGSVVVHVEEYAWGDRGAAQAAPDVRFERFSVLDSTLLLLVPLSIAYLLGVRRTRREQEASGSGRVGPFHDLLGAGFLLLVVAYFAGVPGLALWVGGVGFGVAGLWAAYRLYPEGTAQAPPTRSRRAAAADADGGRLDDMLAMLPGAHAPVGGRAGAFQPPPAAGSDSGWGLPQAPAAEVPDPAGSNGGPLRAPEEAAWAPVPQDEWPPADPPAAGRQPGSPPVPPAGRVQAGPAVRPAGTRTAPAAAPPAPSPTRVRCPACRHLFAATGPRPLSVECPHCGRAGVLR